ncbi:hypothetical protein BASA82_000277 [Batrachochytrium salamandrivorans]|nr:hypothetical protein BASA82_000277 [Batrachochytrium salamandrivorans]
MLCHLSFLQLDEGEEEDDFADSQAQECLQDLLCAYGVVSQLQPIKRTKRTASFKIHLHKQSETLRACNAVNGMSLQITKHTSSLIRTQFLGNQTVRKIKVSFASAVEGKAEVVLRRRFACCGTVLGMMELGPGVFSIEFESPESAYLAVEDFAERQPTTKRARTPLDAAAAATTPVVTAVAASEGEEGLKRPKSGLSTNQDLAAAADEEDEDEGDETVSRHQLFIVHSKQVPAEELDELFKAQLGGQRSTTAHSQVTPTKTLPVKSEQEKDDSRGHSPSNADALIDSFGNAMALGPVTPPRKALRHTGNHQLPPPQQQQQQQPWIADYPQYHYDYPQPYYTPMPRHHLLSNNSRPTSADNSRLYVSYVRPSATNNGNDPITEEDIKQFFPPPPRTWPACTRSRPPHILLSSTGAPSRDAGMLRLNGFNLHGCTLRVVLADPPRMDKYSPGHGGKESESKRRRDDNV